MTTLPVWLPPLVCLKDYQGDWKRYIEAIYQYFIADFVKAKAHFNSRAIGLKRYPLLDGKEATFWHMTSIGKIETERTPDLRRCERIRWPRPVFEHNTEKEIKCWPNQRKNENRIVFWLFEQDYVVILAERNGYLILWTSYMVVYDHQRRKLQQEYEVFLKKADAT
jgi:hypothetical protein